MIDLAVQIAAEAHAGQLDKSGQPYILHPLWIMHHMKTKDEKEVAVLHDVLEDSDHTPNTLDSLGVRKETIQLLKVLSHKEGQSYEDYIINIWNHPNHIVKKVKRFDLRHNMDLSRLLKVHNGDLKRAEKYWKALQLLESKITVAEYRSSNNKPV